ncbi:MAG: hypothetical protein RL705_2106, partial [Bacteroidota bacterium]
NTLLGLILTAFNKVDVGQTLYRIQCKNVLFDLVKQYYRKHRLKHK